MAGLKDLLGENYRDDLTAAEINELLKESKLADLAEGRYVDKGRFMNEQKKRQAIEKELEEFRNAKLSEEEKIKLQLEEREKYYKAVERENRLGKTNMALNSSISDPEIRNKIAELMVDGNNLEAITLQNEYLIKQRTELETKIKADLLKQNPVPTPQNPEKPKTFDDYCGPGGMEALNKLKETNPTEYNKIINN